MDVKTAVRKYMTAMRYGISKLIPQLSNGYTQNGSRPSRRTLRAADLVFHRLRYYTNRLSDVEGYLHS